jgi:hypothetical protein
MTVRAAAGEPVDPGMDITEVLNRRSDLSTFVVHFTKDRGNGRTPKQNLENILRHHTIHAVTAMGWIGDVPTDQLGESKVVCFSETPLEHANLLVRKIKFRQVELAPYGVAFTKATARAKGINPVWYVDMTIGRTWHIKEGLDDLKATAVTSPEGFAAHSVAKVLPFIEQMGTWIETQKEFWWEREWRHRGDMTFRPTELALVLCPERDFDEIEDWGWPAVDPGWSLERMIEKLATVNLGSNTQRRERRRDRIAADDAAESEA